jgi:hypothetical protein
MGVYTNPNHDLWIDSATPSAEGLEIGSSLAPGEVSVGIKSTGICGLVTPSNTTRNTKSNAIFPVPMSISGTKVA